MKKDFFEELQDCIKHGYEFTQNDINKKEAQKPRFGKSPSRGRYSGLSRTPFGQYENR